MKFPLKFWALAGLILLANIVIYSVFAISAATFVEEPQAMMSLSPQDESDSPAMADEGIVGEEDSAGSLFLGWTSVLLPVICGLLGVIGLVGAVAAFKVWDHTKVAWVFFLFGVVLSTIAESLYMVMSQIMGLNVDEIIPSLADIFWMAGYIPIFISLLLLVNGYLKSGLSLGNAKKFLIVLFGGFLVAVFLVIWVFIPIFEDPETGVLTKFVYAYYPVFDLLILIPAAVLILLTTQFKTGSLSIPWKLLALAFLCWSAADIAYSILAWQGLYGDGNFIDLLWNASYLLMGAAGLSQRSLVRSV